MKVYGESQTVNDLIEKAMSKLKGLIDNSTVIGDRIETGDGTTIIPVSKVSVGFVVGGGEYADLSSRRVVRHYPMAGGSSGGMSISPIGFLIEKNGDVSFVLVEGKNISVNMMEIFESVLNKIKNEVKNEK